MLVVLKKTLRVVCAKSMLRVTQLVTRRANSENSVPRFHGVTTSSRVPVGNFAVYTTAAKCTRQADLSRFGIIKYATRVQLPQPVPFTMGPWTNPSHDSSIVFQPERLSLDVRFMFLVRQTPFIYAPAVVHGPVTKMRGQSDLP